jgi:hypothetical protein
LGLHQEGESGGDTGANHSRKVSPLTRATEALALLRRINEARRIGQDFAAEILEEYLEAADRDRGYSRFRRELGAEEVADLDRARAAKRPFRSGP